MSQQFFITGLPRSRTAWFANLFTWGDSICYHDALYPDIHSVAGTNSLRRLQAKMTADSPRGHSCASNIMAWRTLRKWFPDAKWVVIDRRFDDVLKSCSDIEPVCRDSLKLMKCHLDGLIAEIHPMVVNFQDIDPIWSYRVSRYLGIDIGPATRVRQLCDMNIQIHPPVLKQRLENLRMSTNVYTEKTAA